MVRILSLFSGIGGLDLGLERAYPGSRTVAQVESNPHSRAVLRRHWPEAVQFDDVITFRGDEVKTPDLVCGGFPCQDVSAAGKRKGLTGARSGLWYQFLRIVQSTQAPRVVVENVNSGKKLWLPFVIKDLAELGYQVSSVAVSAAEVGCNHLRRRMIVFAEQKGVAPLALSREPITTSYPPGVGQSWGDVPFATKDPQSSYNARRRALGNAVVPDCAYLAAHVAQGHLGIRPQVLDQVLYPTPTAVDYGGQRSIGPGGVRREIRPSIGTMARRMGEGHRLNLSYLERMMGFPVHWTETTID
jgi:DNA (cytosine-5)-methyltransferase 1